MQERVSPLRVIFHRTRLSRRIKIVDTQTVLDNPDAIPVSIDDESSRALNQNTQDVSRVVNIGAAYALLSCTNATSLG